MMGRAAFCWWCLLVLPAGAVYLWLKDQWMVRFGQVKSFVVKLKGKSA